MLLDSTLLLTIDASRLGMDVLVDDVIVFFVFGLLLDRFIVNEIVAGGARLRSKYRH